MLIKNILFDMSMGPINFYATFWKYPGSAAR
jgi:hypothetical protein